MTHPGIRYLLAKRTVDDRALSRPVFSALCDALPPSDPDAPLRVLELGAGAGTMIDRLLGWDVLRYADYTAVDSDGAALAAAASALPRWAAERGLSARVRDDAIELVGESRRVTVRTRHEDLFAYESDERPCDLLIANAVLDLVDVRQALPRLWRNLRPGGLFWFTINFDGETLFLPERDPALEAEVIGLYHRSMDDRTPDGSRTGRRLFARLAQAGARVLAAGASDWVVHAIDGRYLADEATFLHHLLDTIEGELSGHADLDDARLAGWLAGRRNDIDVARLVYIAHQLDFVGRAPAG